MPRMPKKTDDCTNPTTKYSCAKNDNIKLNILEHKLREDLVPRDATTLKEITNLKDDSLFYISDPDKKDVFNINFKNAKAQLVAPHITIGENGNWFIDGVDSGKKSSGIIEVDKLPESKLVGTAVPNDGTTVNNVYFNTNLKINEVEDLIEGLNFDLDIGDLNEEFGGATHNKYYAIAGNFDFSTFNIKALIAVINHEDFIHNTVTINYINTDAPEIMVEIFSNHATLDSKKPGWHQEVFPDNFEIGATMSELDVPEIKANGPIGQNNANLLSLVSSTPFVETEKPKEDIIYKLKEKVLDHNESFAVPNDGTRVDNIYLNTSMSTEEVTNILKTIPKNFKNPFDGGETSVYLVAGNIDLDSQLINFLELDYNEAHDIGFITYINSTNYFDYHILFATKPDDTESITQAGWQLDQLAELNNTISISKTFDEFYYEGIGGPIGTNNFDIRNLVSMSPTFDMTVTPVYKDEFKYSYWRYINNTWREVIHENIVDVDKLPKENISEELIYKVNKKEHADRTVKAGEYIENIYFNLEMSTEEVKAQLAKLNTPYRAVHLISAIPNIVRDDSGSYDTKTNWALSYIKDEGILFIDSRIPSSPIFKEIFAFNADEEITEPGWTDFIKERNGILEINSLSAKTSDYINEDQTVTTLPIDYKNKDINNIMSIYPFNKETPIINSFDTYYRYINNNWETVLENDIINCDNLIKKDTTNVGYTGTCLPIYGGKHVDSIYFNTALEETEVNKILSSIVILPDMGMYIFGGWGTLPDQNDENKPYDFHMLNLMTVSGEIIGKPKETIYLLLEQYDYKNIDHTTDPGMKIIYSSHDLPADSFLKDAVYKGWNTEVVELYKTLNVDLLSIEDVRGHFGDMADSLIFITGQNEMTSSLISTTEFIKEKPINENKLYRLKNKDKADQYFRYKNNTWSEVLDTAIENLDNVAQAVPNTGNIDKIYFNTNLSTKQVADIIEKANLNWIQEFAYPICGVIKADGSKWACVLWKVQLDETTTDYAIMNMFSEDINGNAAELEVYFATENIAAEAQCPIGWNRNFILDDGAINKVGALIAKYDVGGLVVDLGLQNDKLLSLISTKPFNKVDPSKIYKKEKIIKKGWSNKPYPISGPAVPCKFNTNLTMDEIKSGLDNSGLIWSPLFTQNILIAYDETESGFILLSKFVNQNDSTDYCYTCTYGLGDTIFLTNELKPDASPKPSGEVGWKPGFNGEIALLGNLTSLETQLPMQNEKLTWLIGTGEFKNNPIDITYYDFYQFKKNEFHEIITDDYDFPMPPAPPVTLITKILTAPVGFLSSNTTELPIDWTEAMTWTSQLAELSDKVTFAIKVLFPSKDTGWTISDPFEIFYFKNYNIHFNSQTQNVQVWTFLGTSAAELTIRHEAPGEYIFMPDEGDYFANCDLHAASPIKNYSENVDKTSMATYLRRAFYETDDNKLKFMSKTAKTVTAGSNLMNTGNYFNYGSYCKLNGTNYILGGFNTQSATASATICSITSPTEWDPNIQVNQLAASLPTARYKMGIASVSNKAYLFGGMETDGTILTDILKFENEAVTKLSVALPKPLCDMLILPTATDIYLIGGQEATKKTSQNIYKFNIATETVSFVSTALTGLSATEGLAGMNIFSGSDLYYYIIGGYYFNAAGEKVLNSDGYYKSYSANPSNLSYNKIDENDELKTRLRYDATVINSASNTITLLGGFSDSSNLLESTQEIFVDSKDYFKLKSKSPVSTYRTGISLAAGTIALDTSDSNNSFFATNDAIYSYVFDSIYLYKDIVDPATKYNKGTVKIGKNISIDTEGAISVDKPGTIYNNTNKSITAENSQSNGLYSAALNSSIAAGNNSLSYGVADQIDSSTYATFNAGMTQADYLFVTSLSQSIPNFFEPQEYYKFINKNNSDNTIIAQLDHTYLVDENPARGNLYFKDSEKMKEFQYDAWYMVYKVPSGAFGNASFAGGIGTISSEEAQVALGKYNAVDSNAILTIGNGTDTNNRTNVFTVKKDGTVDATKFYKNGTDINDIYQDKLTAGKNITIDPNTNTISAIGGITYEEI